MIYNSTRIPVCLGAFLLGSAAAFAGTAPGKFAVCEMKGEGIQTISTQIASELGGVENGVFIPVQPPAYGFTWYLTQQRFQSADSPKVVFMSRGPKSDDVTIDFNAAESFFTNASDSAGIDALNLEITHISAQAVTTSIEELGAANGIYRTVRVGKLNADRSVSYVAANLHCIAASDDNREEQCARYYGYQDSPGVPAWQKRQYTCFFGQPGVEKLPECQTDWLQSCPVPQNI